MYVSYLEVLPGIEEGAPELPLFHGHDAAGVEHGQELRELPDLEEEQRKYCAWEGTQGTSRSKRAEEVLEQRQELRALPDLEERRGSIDAWAGSRGTSRSRREKRKCFVSWAGTQERPNLEERRGSTEHGQELGELPNLEEN